MKTEDKSDSSSVQFKDTLNKLLKDCICQRKRKSEKKAMKRINKELDVVTFIRRQFSAVIAFETLFSKAERKRIKKNKRFTYFSSSSDESKNNNSMRSELDFAPTRQNFNQQLTNISKPAEGVP